MKFVAVLILTACLAQGTLSFETFPEFQNEIEAREGDSTIGTILCYRGLIKQVRQVVEDAQNLVQKIKKCSGGEKDIFYYKNEEEDSSIGTILCVRSAIKQAKKLVADIKDLAARFEKCTGIGKPESDVLADGNGTIESVICWTKFVRYITSFIIDAAELALKIEKCIDEKNEDASLACIGGLISQITILIKDGVMLVVQPIKCLKKTPESAEPFIPEVPENAECWLEFIILVEKAHNDITPVYKDLKDTALDLIQRYQKCEAMPSNTIIQSAKRKACFTALKARAGVEFLKWRKTLAELGSDAAQLVEKLEECSGGLNPTTQNPQHN